MRGSYVSSHRVQKNLFNTSTGTKKTNRPSNQGREFFRQPSTNVTKSIDVIRRENEESLCLYGTYLDISASEGPFPPASYGTFPSVVQPIAAIIKAAPSLPHQSQEQPPANHA